MGAHNASEEQHGDKETSYRIEYCRDFDEKHVGTKLSMKAHTQKEYRERFLGVLSPRGWGSVRGRVTVIPP